MDEKPKFVVVIGTSAGGFFALAELISQLTEEMDAAFFVVMHLSHRGIGGYLVNQMQKYTSLLCTEAEEKAAIKRGTIYFSQPNKHLLIKENTIELGFGPEENRWRPSIDVLFRSAAAACDGYTIGIILTGMLDDGTAGMSAIKRCGGSCIVQDPNEAEYPDMPLSVLKEIEVDYCVPLSQIGAVISTIIANKKVVSTIIPADIIKEVSLSEKGVGTIDEMKELGNNSVFSCPDCGGVLFELKNGPATRYKCHTGHSYTVNDLLIKQFKNVESSLWVAMRSLEERRKLLTQLAEKNIQRGFHRSASDYQAKIDELQKHVDNLKQVLFAAQKEDVV
jgi:two-component system, chemotaxis family, protein-glutamate methylesterase/glutaminase